MPFNDGAGVLPHTIFWVNIPSSDFASFGEGGSPFYTEKRPDSLFYGKSKIKLSWRRLAWCKNVKRTEYGSY